MGTSGWLRLRSQRYRSGTAHDGCQDRIASPMQTRITISSEVRMLTYRDRGGLIVQRHGRGCAPPRGSAPYPAGASPLRPFKKQKPSHEELIESVVSLPLVGPQWYGLTRALCTFSHGGHPRTLSERKTTGLRCTQFQDHLVLETIHHFRIILRLENASIDRSFALSSPAVH